MTLDKSTKDLISAWRGMQLSKAPYMLKMDRILKEKGLCHPYSCFEDYIGDPGFGSASGYKIHPGLIPIPYAADILKARIYILTLNPGFGPHDYYAESRDKQFREARIRQLRQKDMDKAFPWMDLNPLFCWHDGYKYWKADSVT